MYYMYIVHTKNLILSAAYGNLIMYLTIIYGQQYGMSYSMQLQGYHKSYT